LIKGLKNEAYYIPSYEFKQEKIRKFSLKEKEERENPTL
jgi:hypothetical protein